MIIYHKIPTDDLTDATVIVPNGFEDRGVIKCYDHMGCIVFYPRDDKFGFDGSDALKTAYLPCDKDQSAFVADYSYPLETARRLAAEINTD